MNVLQVVVNIAKISAHSDYEAEVMNEVMYLARGSKSLTLEDYVLQSFVDI